MGKVKGLRGKNTGIIIAHQFPMGKVKAWKEKYPDRVTEYQFPMGKVKGLKQDMCPIKRANKVSIPYGKGKVEGELPKALLEALYQSPMGKVKKVYSNVGKGTTIVYQSPMGKVKSGHLPFYIQSTIVSIPYGKGKEQHLVLCFYYNT